MSAGCDHDLLDTTEKSQRPAAEAANTLRTYISQYDRVYINFSGGKESVTLAHLCLPWRHKCSLVWLNTGYQAEHMVRFIRDYERTYNLIEIGPADDLMDVWARYGKPTELLSVVKGMWGKHERWNAYPLCCALMRTKPLTEYEASLEGHPLVIAGVRLDDVGPDKDRPEEWGPTFVEGVHTDTLNLLRDWTEADVLSYIAAEGLELPIQYGEGVIDSLECVLCPAMADKARVRFLDKHYPEAAALVRSTRTDMIVEAAEVIRSIAASLDVDD